MLYLERRPKPPLNAFVSTLWYARGFEEPRHRQRVLPNGAIQIIINLAANHTVDCRNPAAPGLAPAALAIGVHSRFQVIDTADLAEVIGVQFHPGGFLPFAACPPDELANEEAPLDALWGSEVPRLRDQLLSAPTPEGKVHIFENALLEMARFERLVHPAVRFGCARMLEDPGITRIDAVVDSVGLSRRRFTELFRSEVGVTPKLFCRIRRFRHAVDALRRQTEIDWTALALSCGYFDQPHFVNDFRAFSGINPTAYPGKRGPWSGHIAIEDIPDTIDPEPR